MAARDIGARDSSRLWHFFIESGLSPELDGRIFGRDKNPKHKLDRTRGFFFKQGRGRGWLGLFCLFFERIRCRYLNHKKLILLVSR